MIEPLSARNVAKFGTRRAANDGVTKRRLVPFATH
jgi:hypothetical protein